MRILRRSSGQKQRASLATLFVDLLGSFAVQCAEDHARAFNLQVRKDYNVHLFLQRGNWKATLQAHGPVTQAGLDERQWSWKLASGSVALEKGAVAAHAPLRSRDRVELTTPLADRSYVELRCTVHIKGFLSPDERLGFECCLTPGTHGRPTESIFQHGPLELTLAVRVVDRATISEAERKKRS